MGLDIIRLNDLRRIRDEAECLADEPTVNAAIDQMASDIAKRLFNADPLILAVLNGGLVLAGNLLPRLNFPLELSWLHVTRYGQQSQGGEIEWHAPPNADVQGRSVLVVDDILDVGHTLLAIVERLHEQGAGEILTAVLVDKQHDRKARPGLKADFTGLELPDRFMFGSGMDYRGYWRNAAGIHAVKGL
ncbi:MAG: hypoxanthine-guanine phosphoribosyltransferase [Azoarcus sp.]|jgi:hypoxanthine phosphoribosyltransferase|nr:hypoxanthine-guanine phosphoribosyltransferase [Azoarcus sp.]